MTEAKTIGNVNVLDIRKTTEEGIAQIGHIRNVNIVMYSPATASYLGRLDIGNVNASIEVPADVELQTTMGTLRLSPDSVGTSDGTSFRLVMGNVLVERSPASNATGEFLEGVAGLAVMGNVICPQSLSGVLEPKIKQLMGGFIPYPDDATLVAGRLELTRGFLAGLDSPTGFVVTGSLLAIEDASEELKRKVEYLQVHGTIVCAEENVDAIRSKLRGGKGRMTIVPSGFRYHEGDLGLDAATLESLDGARLFCTGTVLFGTDAQPPAVQKGLAGLRSLGLIVCPERLKDAVKTKVDMIKDRIVFYEGELWLFDDEHTLHASRFDYLDGKATVLVSGDLRIDAEVTPSVLADRFLVVHNLGTIRCTPEQMGVIEARLGIHDGDLLDSTPQQEERFDIGNANIFAL